MQVDITTTGERIAFQKKGSIGDAWQRVEVLQLRGVDADETRVRIEYFYESSLEIYSHEEITIPEWAEPLKRWNGDNIACKVGTYLSFWFECSTWKMVMVFQNESLFDWDIVRHLLLGGIENPVTVSLFSTDDPLSDQALVEASVAVKLISMPGMRESGIEILRNVLLGIRNLYLWPRRRRKGESNRHFASNRKDDRWLKTMRRAMANDYSRALVVMFDVLLRKYSVMKKKERYEIIRHTVKKECQLWYEDDGSLDKIIIDNKYLKAIFELGHDEWKAQRKNEILKEVDDFIKEIVEKIP